MKNNLLSNYFFLFIFPKTIDFTESLVGRKQNASGRWSVGRFFDSDGFMHNNEVSAVLKALVADTTKVKKTQ